MRFSKSGQRYARSISGPGSLVIASLRPFSEREAAPGDYGEISALHREFSQSACPILTQRASWPKKVGNEGSRDRVFASVCSYPFGWWGFGLDGSRVLVC